VKNKIMTLNSEGKNWTTKKISKKYHSVKSTGFDLHENNFEFLQRGTKDEIKDIFYALVEAENVMNQNNL